VLDGVGVGEAPDAERYGDRGSNSLANTARHVGSLRLPALQRMGLGNIADIEGVPPCVHPTACYGRMTPRSAGKDSISGHWELAGCVVKNPFPTYPRGFPAEVVAEFERAVGRIVLGNRTASGTAIIQELGEEHVASGRPILYTSQDSVFQVAAHESVISVEALYDMCEAARRLLVAPNGVARVIARPFAGDAGGFYRTPRRRDFALAPPTPTLLDLLVDGGYRVLAVGKVAELFCGRGVTSAVTTVDNRDGMRRTLEAVAGEWDLVFVNLVDFDTMWGHRNDARAYALGLEEFDSFLLELLGAVDAATLLLVTSDHGNDPTTESTDHSREYVPIIAYNAGSRKGSDLGVRNTFADVAATIADNFAIDERFSAVSFLSATGGDN
jgi:phosphopentomutase